MTVPERFCDEQPHCERLAFEHELRYGFAASLSQGREVLDLGAGVGLGSLACLAAGAAAVTAVEADPGALARLRERLSGHAGAQVVAADLHRLPWEGPRFDRGLLLEVIEHVGDPEAVLAEARRVLRPDALLLVSTPARERAPNPYHRRLYSKAQLRALLRKVFPHVRLFRQAALWGGVIVAESSGGARMRVEAPEAETWLAVASARKLPARIAPAASWRMLESYERATLWRLGADVRHLLAERDGLKSELSALRRSPGWRLAERLGRWMAALK